MTIWRYVLLASLFIFPQLLGILLFHRLHWAPRWIARAVSILAPAVIFFLLAPFFFFEGVSKASAREVACGMPMAAGAIFLLLGTTVQLGLGVVGHVFLAASARFPKVR